MRAIVESAMTMHCVFLTCFRAPFFVLATTLHYSGVRLHQAASLEEADFLLTVTDAKALLCDVTFPDGDWRDALRMVEQSHRFVPFLIAADPVDAPFLSDACTRGACGILWKPFDFTLAIHTVRAAGQAARDRAALAAESSLAHAGPAQ